MENARHAPLLYRHPALRYKEEVKIIDCDYLFPQFAATYLLREGDEAAFIESNTAHAVPRMLGALRDLGLDARDVRYVVITHAHLDHAGGASALLAACPNAELLTHPKAAGHLIDPSRLIASAQKVYGLERFEKLYGRMDPIPASRVRAMEDDECLRFGSREFRFLHTRGHANHHVCMLDSGSGGIFTGDSFGLAYPAAQSHGLFIFPSTSPTGFEPEEARKSVRRIVESGATHALLTHFGKVSDLQGAQEQLLAHLDFSEHLLEDAVACADEDAKLPEYCKGQLFRYFRGVLQKRGLQDQPGLWDLLSLDLELNADGIAYVAQKARNKKGIP